MAYPALRQAVGDAGLVRVRVDGPRRLYRADPDGLARLRRELDGFWGPALDGLKTAAETESTEDDRWPMTELRDEITIEAVPEVVFRHLTEREGLLRWMAVEATFDPVPGGELPAESVDDHRLGWQHFLAQLATLLRPMQPARE